MKLLYAGTDMTAYTNISACTIVQHSDRAMDTAEITLDNASDWSRWKPETGDEIEITEDGFRTGKLFLRKVKPQNGKYTITAASVPVEADEKAWQSFEQVTFANIASQCARRAGLGWQMVGVGGDFLYPYLMRKDQGVLSFLREMCRREGAVLKCWDGMARIVSIKEAGARKASISMTISAQQQGVTYKRDEGKLWKNLTVRSGNISAIALSTDGKGAEVEMNLPAGDKAIAARWAENLLALNNREAETLVIESEINLKAAALERVDITGGTEADGKWMIDTAEHDLMERRTRIKMMRVVS